MSLPDPKKHLIGYGRIDAATGLVHGYVRWPHGTAPTPSGCRWCGSEKRSHFQRFLPRRGFHAWVQPTQAQIKARMLARRNARKSVCRCPEPWEAPRPFAPVVDPWRCEAARCRMHDHLLGMWLTPLSYSEAMARLGGGA
jgi:hypothetical protein